jgi:putative MATE family efflux protein
VVTLLFPREIIGIYSRDPAVIEAGAAYLQTLAPSFVPYGISFAFILVLRSIERVRLAMATSIIALFVNMGLNYVFIFGLGPIPAMGVVGAARATVISRFTEMIILVTVSYSRRYAMAGSLREFLGFSTSFVRRFLKIALPVIVNELVWALGVTVQNIIMARTHTDAIAAFNITNTVSQLTWVVFIGLGHGTAVLVGNKIGAGDEATARDYAARATRFAPLVAATVAFILIPLSRFLPFLFNVNPGVFEITSVMFILLACSYPFRAFNMTMIIGACRAGGDTVFCVIYDLIFMWLVSLPLAAAATFIFHAPVWFIYLLIVVEDPLKMILGIWRLKSGKWLNNVT